MIYFGRKMDVVQFALDLQTALGNDLQSIMITRVGKSGDCCASIVIDMSLADTVSGLAATYSLTRTDTLPKSTVDGLYRVK